MAHGEGKKDKKSSKSSSSSAPYIIGSATSGILEIILFHPIDTIAKRLMSNTKPIFVQGSPLGENMGRLGEVIFKDAQSKSTFRKWLSLFPGISFGAAYKILQRTYKFGSQPILKDYFERRYGEKIVAAFGSKKTGLDMLQATSGALVGIGEVVLLPLDVLKIKAQTNPEALKGRGLIDIIVKENVKLYRGILWTAARNAPGSFALFGANSLVYTRVFGIDGPRNAKGYQIFFGSMAGGIASIVVSSPLDVIKTRIQKRSFDDHRSGMKLVRELIKEEGPFAFFKGLTPKIGLIGPKLVFSFSVAQALITQLEIVWEEKGWNKPSDGHIHIDNNKKSPPPSSPSTPSLPSPPSSHDSKSSKH